MKIQRMRKYVSFPKKYKLIKHPFYVKTMSKNDDKNLSQTILKVYGDTMIQPEKKDQRSK